MHKDNTGGVEQRKIVHRYIGTVTEDLQFMFTRYIHGQSFRKFRQCQIVEYPNDFYVH